MADELRVRRWVIDLGKLTATRISHDEAADFIDTMTPPLASRFPNEAFNPVSLEAVAAECKYLPTYGELVEHLRDWWRQHRPVPRALPEPPPARRPDATAEERAHVTWAAAQAIAALRSAAQPEGERQKPGPRCLSPEQLTDAYRRVGTAGPRTP